MTVLYHYGQFQFTCGNYSAASDYLYHFRILSTDADLNTSAHWGKLAADILSGKWAVALEELNTMRDAVDARAGPLPGAVTSKDTVTGPLFQLHARSWVLHWSLFVYLKNGEADPAVLRAALLDTFLAPAYLNTVQTSCPWLLRYIATVAVLARRASAAPGAQGSARVRHALKEVVRLVQLEAYQYKDPVTEFLRELYVEFDFERAQKELARAEGVVADDFFLGDFRDEFMENARYLITEAYCRIHQKIDIGHVSSVTYMQAGN
jgi:translation initiation factor 3 subunit E